MLKTKKFADIVKGGKERNSTPGGRKIMCKGIET